MNEIITEKYCSKCKQTKPIDCFSKDKYCKDGIRKWCRTCRYEANKKWYANNKDEINAKQREWRLKNPRKNSEYILRWVSKDGNRLYRKKYCARWKLENREKTREQGRIRRAREKNAKGVISSKEWNDVIKKLGKRCLCCGREDVPITMDHIVPLCLGGTHTIDNVQPLCVSCNSRKHTKVIDYRKQDEV